MREIGQIRKLDQGLRRPSHFAMQDGEFLFVPQTPARGPARLVQFSISELLPPLRARRGEILGPCGNR